MKTIAVFRMNAAQVEIRHQSVFCNRMTEIPNLRFLFQAFRKLLLRILTGFIQLFTEETITLTAVTCNISFYAECTGDGLLIDFKRQVDPYPAEGLQK